MTARSGIIYVTAWPCTWTTQDVEAAAIAEDGTFLAAHVCPSWTFVLLELGERKEKLALYRKHYPDGFRLVFVRMDERDTHVEFQAALAKCRARVGRGAKPT